MAVAFGTSGLRGPAFDFTPALCDAYVTAFLEHCGQNAAEHSVFLAGDLRDSSPSIINYCLASAKTLGWSVVYAGNVPTPALAAYATERRCPAIMVTGSHIPETYNGIKFYAPDGEFLKADEAPVKMRAEQILASPRTISGVQAGNPDPAVARAYVDRYVDAFGVGALKGLRLGVDLHSAVGRDLLVEILDALGADCLAYRRSDHFIAVDTEALDPADIALNAAMISKYGLHAVVSTDGDGDRPLVIDENGKQVNGDVLGILTARALGIKTVVTPLSTTSALEQSGWFDVVRTRIGSPYVVDAMMMPAAHPVAGFEPNGGFLLQDDLQFDRGLLRRLPTRDALLPIIAVLKAAKTQGVSVAQLAAALPARFMRADRLKDVAYDKSAEFLKEVELSRDLRANLDVHIADPSEISRIDGLRMGFSDGSTVHFRPSGNAPELRCYVETSSLQATDTLLAELMTRLKSYFAVGESNA